MELLDLSNQLLILLELLFHEFLLLAELVTELVDFFDAFIVEFDTISKFYEVQHVG